MILKHNNKKDITRNRNVCFDIARSIATIYIVGLWHVRDYVNGDFAQFFGSHFFSKTTEIMLGAFMFISGFFLSRYKFNRSEEVGNFYIKRLVRFYPLFFLAALTLFIGRFNPDYKVFLTTISGISTFIPPQPRTLWFLSMLMMFYAFTPLLLYNFYRYKVYSRLTGFLLVISFLLLIFLACGKSIDNRFYYCFLCYISGIYVGEANLIEKLQKVPVVILTASIIVLSLFFPIVTVLRIDILCGVIILLYISDKFAKIKGISGIAFFTGYISMCMYLFHRHIYTIIKFLFVPNGEQMSLGLCYFVALPLIFVFSYIIQYLYDKMTVNKLKLKFAS